MLDGSHRTVQEAKNAVMNQQFVTFLFDTWAETFEGTRDQIYTRAMSMPVPMHEFAQFIKFFLKGIRDEKCNDIFMNVKQELPRLLK